MPIKFAPKKEQQSCELELSATGAEAESFTLPLSLILFFWNASFVEQKPSDITKVGELTVRMGRPLKGQESQTLKAIKPWEAMGLSRRTWFRRRSKGLIK